MAALHLPDTIVLERRPEPIGLMEAVVDHWEHALRQRLTQTNPRPLGLATGRTMEPFYAALRERLRLWGPTERARLHQGWLSFNLDEYVGRSLLIRTASPLTCSISSLALWGCRLISCGFRMVRPPIQNRRRWPMAKPCRRLEGLVCSCSGSGPMAMWALTSLPAVPDVICRCVSLCRATQGAERCRFWW